MEHNFTYIRENLVEWSVQGYEYAIPVFFWALLFSAIIGYVYLKQESLVAAAITAMIITSVFGGALLGLGTWVIAIQVFVTLIITSLILYFISKRRT